MINTHPILLPVLVLVLWSMVQLIWMAATRLPAIGAAKLGPAAGQRTAELAGQIPKEVQWKADNYNHLMEQPTLFYATAITLAVVGLGTGLNLYLAWLYTGLRVVHSIVQSTTNPVMVRFSLFILGSLALAAMAVNGVMQML
jgi:hypothetical protein